jgi:hypothetical protein
LQPVTSSMSVSGLDDEWAEEGRRKPFMGFSG